MNDERLRKLRDFECGKLAFYLNFGRDDYDCDEDTGPDEIAAWQLGWDEAQSTSGEHRQHSPATVKDSQ